MQEPPPSAEDRAATEAAPAAERGAVLFLYFLTFLSGSAALVYQVAWARMLSLTFGSTTLSTAAVVASFMGGMGLGAWLYHRIYDRLSRPLLLFAILEVGIALSTALLTATFYSLPDVFAGVAASLGSGLGLEVARFLSVFALLVVPATLMGATFPALCTVMIRSAGAVDRHLGLIYGINTIGAAGGGLFAGLFLIERVGLGSSVTVANGINVAVAIAAFLLLRGTLGRTYAEPPASEDTAIPTFLPRRLTGVVLLLSGFTTLSYEMYWIRTFKYVMGNSTYALTTTIIVFLVGLGSGSLLLRFVLRRGTPERDLALIQSGIAVLSMLTVTGITFVLSNDSLRESITIFSDVSRQRPWALRLVIQAGLAVVTMLPATMLMGLTFPLATRLFLGDVRKLGRRVGMASFLANAGSILGSIVGAAILLPAFGTVGGTKFSAFCNLGLAVVLAVSYGGRVKGLATRLVPAGVLVVVGAFLLPATPHFLGEVEELGLRQSRLIHQEEADLGTVQVLEVPGDPSSRSMSIDGTTIGLSEGFRGGRLWKKQVILVHLPMAIDADVRSVLNIGLGGGSTLDVLADYEKLERMDCVEINPAVVRAAELFPEYSVLEDPRVDMIVDDAIHFLLKTERQYDLIVSDGKQHPFFAGNAMLLCREFYQFAKDRLDDDGLFAQWMPLGTLNEDFVVNLRTLCDVFPHVGLFFFPPDSVLVIASKESLAGRSRMTPEEFASGPASRDLGSYGITGPDALLSRCAAYGKHLSAAIGEGPISRWDKLILDFTPFKASPQQWTMAEVRNLETILKAELLRSQDASDPLGLTGSRFLLSSNKIRLAFYAHYRRDNEEAARFAQEAISINPDDEAAAQALLFFRSRGGEAGRDG